MSALRDIKRGALSDDERAAIERLATSLKRPTPSAIARRLNRHPATIAWHMIRAGQIDRKVAYAARRPHTRRNGITVNPYTPAQDRRLIELRRSGKVFREIAEILTAEFRVPRSTHSAHVRCAMLSAYEGAPE